MNHLGHRVSALVDGQLGHEARDRALAHVAHCPSCREALEAERAVKTFLETTPSPPPSTELLAALRGMAEPGEPVGPRARPMPLGPVVPNLPPPGRGPLGRRRDTRTDGRTDSRRPGARTASRARRLRYAAAGALSVAGLLLGTAFAAGGGVNEPGTPVVPPSAELSVEHAATTSQLPLGDPAFTAVTASVGGLAVPGAPAR